LPRRIGPAHKSFRHAHVPRRPPVETLEGRLLFATVPPGVLISNVSRTTGNDAEANIAVDPTNPLRVLAASNIGATDGLRVGVSDDGGATWQTRVVAGDGSDGLPVACCDPSVAFDAFGNAYLAYAIQEPEGTAVLASSDGGRSFSVLGNFDGHTDQPTVTTGPGGVWVTFEEEDEGVRVAGAPVTGLGAFGAFTAPVTLADSDGGNFGDIAVGADGQVMVTYQKRVRSKQAIVVHLDPDGFGPSPFGGGVTATSTAVRGFSTIPAQRGRKIDAEADLAFDRSNGPFHNRAYLVYTDRTPAISFNTDVLLRYSDDSGQTWSEPIRVNDDGGVNSQFLPRMAVDDATGTAGFVWHDTRDDEGTAVSEDNTNARPNDDANLYAALAFPADGGMRVTTSVRLTAAPSNASVADSGVDFGDYLGLDFVAGNLYPAWADNSNATNDNPDGRLTTFDLYAGRVPEGVFAAPPVLSLGSLPDATGRPVVRIPASTKREAKGKAFRLTLTVADDAALDPATVGAGTVAVTGPNAYSRSLTPTRLRRVGTTITATYLIPAPSRRWSFADRGTYVLSLADDQLEDAAGTPALAGVFGFFVVQGI
jgi:hypothetical protein